MKARVVRVLLIASILVFLVGCPGLFDKLLTLSIPDQEVLQGETLEIELDDYVSGGRGTLVFTIEEGPGEIDGSTYTYTPGYDVFDDQTVKIRVKDDMDESVEDTFVITIEAFEVEFEDENLEAVVRQAINKPEGPIHKSDVQHLTELDARGKGIESLEGIQHLKSLQILNLSRDTNTDTRNYISDITPLSDLTNLVELGFWDNSVSDISALAGLTGLWFLHFGSNSVSDISPLEGLTNLVWLYFEDNSVSDISPLSGLTNLERLMFWGNLVSDISPLAGLTSLELLYFGGNSISDISPLGGLTSLRFLTFWGNSVSDISPLAGLTNLVWLAFGGNSVNDISPLAGLTKLEWLYFEDNSVSDISPLEELTKLERLRFWDNSVSDISVLAGLTNLEHLILGHNLVNDISALVENAGIAYGDYVDIRHNYLNLTPGSQNMNDIQTLLDRGVEVNYDPQREPGESVELHIDHHRDKHSGDIFWLEEVAYRWEMRPPQ